MNAAPVPPAKGTVTGAAVFPALERRQRASVIITVLSGHRDAAGAYSQESP